MTKRKPPALNVHIRAARLAAGLHQSELGDRIGVTQQHIQQLESGKRVPSVQCLIAICKATDCEFPIDKKTVLVEARPRRPV